MPRGNIKRRGLLPQDLRRRRRRLFFWKMGAYVFGVALLVGGMGVAARIDALRVDRIYVDGAVTAGADAVRETVARALTGSHIFLFPRNNTFLISRTDIASRIEAVHPKVRNATVRRHGLQALAVSVEERTPTAVWCPPEASGEADVARACYFASAEGFIFSPVWFSWSESGTSSQRLPRLLTALQVVGEPIGQQALPSDEFASLLRFDTAERSRGLGIFEVRPLKGEDLELVLDGGVRAYVPRGTTLPSALENLSLVLGSDVALDDPSLDYIDLRFGNKVFYTEKNTLKEESQ